MAIYNYIICWCSQQTYCRITYPGSPRCFTSLLLPLFLFRGPTAPPLIIGSSPKHRDIWWRRTIPVEVLQQHDWRLYPRLTLKMKRSCPYPKRRSSIEQHWTVDLLGQELFAQRRDRRPASTSRRMSSNMWRCRSISNCSFEQVSIRPYATPKQEIKYTFFFKNP